MQSALLKDESDHLNAISMQSACNQRSSKTNRTTSAEYLAAGEPAISMQSACNRTTSAEYLAAGEPSHWPIHRRCSTMGIEMPHLMREQSEAIRRGQRRSDAKRVNQSQSESIRGPSVSPSTPMLMVTAHELASSTPLLMVTASVLWGKARRTRTLPSTLL